MLRDYQRAACQSIIDSIKKSTDRIMIEAATGAGKSHIIAHVAHFIANRSDKKIVCLAPSKELVEQNHHKYIAIGEKASIYSASAGSKCMRYPVVFATPVTLNNNIKWFTGKVSAVIVDECHNMGNTIKSIISDLQSGNENLRVIGLTATPYRTKKGYIFLEWPDGKQNNAENCIDPYFKKLVYRITADELIAKNYLTAPAVEDVKDHYDTSNLKLNSMGKFDAKLIDQAFIGRGRLTSQIISDVVERSYNRNGVIIFCATIQHANEAMESLPPQLSAIVTGKTKKAERELILKKFKAKEIKYLVNVAVLTTGFDAPHVDGVAILRATESPGLFQQIIGRGLRLADNKEDCLILDYAENIKRHCPDGDIFNPELTVYKPSGGERFEIVCETCEQINNVAPVNDIEDLKYNKYGYLIDLNENEITDEKGDKIPVHHGRRCQNYIEAGKEFRRCPQRWNSKECPECEMPNDITARHCVHCGSEMIDPNEKLTLDFTKFKASAYNLQTDEVINFTVTKKISMKGNETLMIEWVTPYRRFKSYHTPAYNQKWHDLFGDYNIDYIADNLTNINTVTYQKKQTGFFEIYGFNRQKDELKKDE